MAKKLFISFLGASVYEKCIYHDDQRDYPETLFIQEATLRQIGVEKWKVSDSVKIFLTDLAYEKNWDKNIHSRINNKKEVVPYVGLEKIIDDMHLTCDTTPVKHVPLGKSEEELWQIFKLIYDKIKDFDELYIDLTHAFRYLPMLLLVLSNYAKFLSNVTIKHISYGSYEGRDKNNRAPIIDLLPLSKLQDWTTAASEFIKYGDASGLNRMTEDNLNDVFVDKSSTTDEKKHAGIVKSFTSALKNYSLERITCRGKNIVKGKAAKSLSRQINTIKNKLKKETGLEPLNPIFVEIGKTISTSDDPLENCIDAAKWCYEKNLYQQSITLLEEGLITMFCNRHQIAIDNSTKQRDLVTSALKIRTKKLPEDEWTVDEKNWPKLRELLQDELFDNKQLFDSFNKIEELRNDYNHANFRQNYVDTNTIINNIKEEINTCGSLLLPNFEKIK